MQNKQPVNCEAQLAELAYPRPVLSTAIWARKVFQGDLVFDVRLGFASGSVRARLQVCVQRLRLVPPWLSQNLIRTF